MSRAAWLVPTARLVPWAALGLPLATVGAAGALTEVGGGRPAGGTLALAAVGTAAAALSWCLDDPAHQLLAPLPVSRRRRAGHRLALGVPVVALGWLAVAAWWIAVPGSVLDQLAPLLALGSTGVAAAAAAHRWRPELAAMVGVAAPLALAGGPIAFGIGGEAPDVLRLWLEHPWWTAALGALVALAALADPGWRRGRGRARPVRGLP